MDHSVWKALENMGCRMWGNAILQYSLKSVQLIWIIVYFLVGPLSCRKDNFVAFKNSTVHIIFNGCLVLCDYLLFAHFFSTVRNFIPVAEPLFTCNNLNEVLGITNNIPSPSNGKIMWEKNLDLMSLLNYSEHILSVPWPFVILRFHCK